MNVNYLDLYLSKVTIVFFILLYPVYVVYNTLLAYGIIPPIFGGFYGGFSFVYIFMMLPILFNITKSYNLNNYCVLIFMYVMYILFFSIINYFSVDGKEIEVATSQALEALLLLISALFLGYYLKLNDFLKTFLFLFLLFSLLFLIGYVLKTGEVMFYAKTLATDVNVDNVSTYQGYGRTFFIISLLMLALIKKIHNFVLIYFVSLFILFVIGSRSELVAFALSGAILTPIKYSFNFKYIFYYFLFIFLFFIFIGFVFDNFSDNRSVQLLDASDSSSWQSREALSDIALDQIKRNPILGYFGGHIIEGGSSGSYAHNILSVWANFGIVAFIMYILLCLIPLVECSYLFFIKKIKTVEIQFCFLLSVSVFILVIFSKPVFWFIPGILFGSYLKVKSFGYGK